MSLFLFWSWKEKQNCRWVPLRAAAVCCCLRQSRGGCISSWDTSGKWKQITFDFALQRGKLTINHFKMTLGKKKSLTHHLTSITLDGRRKVSLCSDVNIPAWISEASRLFWADYTPNLLRFSFVFTKLLYLSSHLRSWNQKLLKNAHIVNSFPFNSIVYFGLSWKPWNNIKSCIQNTKILAYVMLKTHIRQLVFYVWRE